jgi:hydrogenase/urease accessory protein HupE
VPKWLLEQLEDHPTVTFLLTLMMGRHLGIAKVNLALTEVMAALNLWVMDTGLGCMVVIQANLIQPAN